MFRDQIILLEVKIPKIDKFIISAIIKDFRKMLYHQFQTNELSLD